MSLHCYLYANANWSTIATRGEINASPMPSRRSPGDVIGIPLIPFTRVCIRLLRSRDQFFGLVRGVALFAIPVVLRRPRACIAAGTVAVAVGRGEGRAALRIVRGLVEFMGQETLEAVLTRGIAFARKGGQIFEFAGAAEGAARGKPAVLAGARQFVQNLKLLAEIPGTRIFRSPRPLADFNEFFGSRPGVDPEGEAFARTAHAGPTRARRPGCSSEYLYSCAPHELFGRAARRSRRGPADTVRYYQAQACCRRRSAPDAGPSTRTPTPLKRIREAVARDGSPLVVIKRMVAGRRAR